MADRQLRAVAGSYPRLLGIDAIDAGDVWRSAPSSRGERSRIRDPLGRHRWSEVTVPDDEPYQTTLVDVDAVAPD
jgi:hypothetical protein